MNSLESNEKYLSQIPAVELLIKLGYKFISPAEAKVQRLNRNSNVLLEVILYKKLKEINRFSYKGQIYRFSEENIQSAIQKIKNIKFDGLLKTNEAVYDLITLGTSLEQNVEGNIQSFDITYIDWKNPSNNEFHVAVEYKVERSRSNESVRPDIVLFVNGIPFTVIECKSPDTDVEQAVSQNIRNQGTEYIPNLFIYTQLLLSINKNKALYATTGTSAKFWSNWQEKDFEDGNEEFNLLQDMINQPIESALADKLAEVFKVDKDAFNKTRLVTEQDKSIYFLCRPERLLELAFKFTLFDNGTKKIARYQQYFVVKETLSRVKQFDNTSLHRKGGIIWHTQGSGKSLTMVMLTRNLALDAEINNPRIVLVTDRDDLDKQLGNTFIACGIDAQRATSGRKLLELVSNQNASIITTLIHKFDKAFSIKKFSDESKDIFVLVDESHRTQFGSFSARMRQMFPNACYIGFTGTPLMKEEKNSFAKFGGIIEPHYSISQAVEDGAVVPLLYEGRLVELNQNKAAIDKWFERHTKLLTEKQKADLKKKYARASMLNKADQVVYMRAFDISEQYVSTWQNTGFKAQLVAPSKPVALKYKEYLTEIGDVTCEVVISPPDMREGETEVGNESTDEVKKFWTQMMHRYGTEEEYTKQIINQFKHGSEPEILIVVSKLLTGFDAPKNVVLYICKEMREHNLLQAIARVNRLFPDKDFGFIIDYVGLLGELDSALTMYSVLEGFEEKDLTGTLKSINNEIEKLPQYYSDLWDLFKAIKLSDDQEEYEQFLGDLAVREDFYYRLNNFAKSFKIAIASEKFLSEIDNNKLDKYKSDLKWFFKLKASVKLRYAEAVDYSDYEPKIKKLLDTHIQANEVYKLNEPVNIFDKDVFNKVKEEQAVYNASQTTASKADTIAHATKRTITEKMEDDPTFYRRFSILIQTAIDDFRAKRINDIEYLNKVNSIKDKIVNNIHENMPSLLKGKDDAIAYYGLIENILLENNNSVLLGEIALKIDQVIANNQKVNFWDDDDAKNNVINSIEDIIFDELQNESSTKLTLEQIDDLIEKIMKVAERRLTK